MALLQPIDPNEANRRGKSIAGRLAAATATGAKHAGTIRAFANRPCNVSEFH